MTDEPITPGPTSPVPSPVLPDECCARCKNFLAGPKPELPCFCRLNPPVPFLTQINWNEDKSAVISNQQMSTQPVVNPAGWCSHFTRRATDVQ